MILQKWVGGWLFKVDINNEIKKFKELFLSLCKLIENYEEIKFFVYCD